MYKLIILDLDGTLLHSDKSISQYTINTLEKCRSKGILIGISTARGETNAKHFISKINPEVVISSGGALVSYRGNYIYASAFTSEETQRILNTVQTLTNGKSEITVDTRTCHYWNYKIDPHETYPDRGEVVYTDYRHFNEEALKICVETSDKKVAERVAKSIGDCDFIKFSDGDWYKFTKASATKAGALREIAGALHLIPNEIISFGDDYADIEMLKICGRGIAMGNAIDEVKQAADEVTDSNDKDGAAKYLEKYVLNNMEMENQTV